MKKVLSYALSMALFITMLAAAQPAQAASGTVTIVASGGSPENTNWTYTNNTIDPSTSVSINASDIVAKLANGPLTILGDKILINASIIYTNSNALTFKPTGTILVNGGVTIESQGGDLVFNADSDVSGAGFVRFGLGTVRTAGAINSNGGRIIVGGGANPLTGFAFAQNLDGPVTADATACVGGTPPLAGIGIYAFAFNSGNGNISMNGSTAAIASRGFNIAGCSWGGAVSFTATGNGSIYLNGDGSLSTTNPWGIAAGAMSFTTANGNITLEGKGGANVGNARGIGLGGATNLTSTNGNISLLDTTNGQSALDFQGTYFGGAISMTTGGSVSIKADEFYHTGYLTLDTPSASIQPSTGNSFSADFNVGPIAAANADGLTIGKAGNTAAVNINSAISVGGAINLIAGAVGINAALASTTDISITASGNVTQSAAISSVGLALAGTGAYNLSNAGNNVTTLAAGSIASLTFADSNGFAVGTVGNVSGMNAVTPPTISVNGTTNYRVSFSSQGGSSVADVLFPSGGSATLPAAPSRPGYSFRGWYTAASGGTLASSTYTPGVASNVTLYAQWAEIPPPVSLGAIAFSGTDFSISGSNLDRISEVKINGQPVKLVPKDSKSVALDLKSLAPGSYTVELIGEGIKMTWENAIVIKPIAPQRETTATTQLPTFTGGSASLSTTQKTAIKSLIKSAVALTCVGSIGSKATAAQKRTALAQAQSVCNYAKSVSPTLTPSRVQATVAVSGTKNSVSFAVTKK